MFDIFVFQNLQFFRMLVKFVIGACLLFMIDAATQITRKQMGTLFITFSFRIQNSSVLRMKKKTCVRTSVTELDWVSVSLVSQYFLLCLNDITPIDPFHKLNLIWHRSQILLFLQLSAQPRWEREWATRANSYSTLLLTLHYFLNP